MKKILLFGIAFCLYAHVNAQKVHFIYLQSEAASPFFVKMADKIYSSTAEGYLIISMLKDSSYTFSVGQPGKNQEPKFSVTINKADRGFLLRNMNGEPNLYDLQSMAVYKPLQGNQTTQITKMKTDRFSTMLAEAADDSTLLYEMVALQEKPASTEKKDVVSLVKNTTDANKKEPVKNEKEDKPATAAVFTTANIEAAPKPQVVQTSVQKEELTESVASQSISVKENASENVQQENNSREEYVKSVILRKSESSTSEGFGLVYLDEFNGEVDTVRLLIPNPKPGFPQSNNQQPKEQRKFLEISTEVDSPSTQKTTTNPDEEKVSCANQATDKDFLQLRKNMAARETEDGMIAEAKKCFETKCFTTEQIKNLSALFLTSAGKYHFYEVAYMHVVNQDQFVTLQKEIKDNYFSNRFKTLTAQ